MTLRDRLKPKASPPPPPPLPAAQPLQRQARHVMEMTLGDPQIDVELYQRIHDINTRTIRRFCATFPRPGKRWGDPDITAMQIMFGAALETLAAKVLESVTAVRVGDAYPEDEVTEKMEREPLPLGPLPQPPAKPSR